MKKLGLYLHIPFCVKKCAYCDFLSSPAGEEEKHQYTEALKAEIRSYSGLGKEYLADSIFFGGGTPSILPAELIKELMDAVRESFSLETAMDGTEAVEITMEANPGTLSRKKLEIYKSCGINRLSMGLQSADNGELERLGRIHTWETFVENYQLARECGFENINIDLMSALPGQTYDSYRETLEKVLLLKPEHISAYSLIIEEGTPFYAAGERDELLLPDEEEERKMYYLTETLLSEAGYSRYEISNYAKKGRECRHNNKYWTGEDYLGMGLGASSYLKGCRLKNTDSLKEYKKRTAACESLLMEKQVLTRQEKIEEFMFLGLRRMEGVKKDIFLKCFGEELSEVYGEIMEKQEKNGLIAQDETRVWLTKRGIDVSNQVMADYLF